MAESQPANDRIWELRNPDGGMMGLEFARGLMDGSHEVVLAHALPERVDVEVRTSDGEVVARGGALAGGDSTPMGRLSIEGDRVVRENVWPTSADHGRPVILAGGEVGILTAWWNASDGSAWRWSVEFSNHT